MTEKEIREEFIKLGHKIGRMDMTMQLGNVSKAEFGILMLIQRMQSESEDERGIYVSRIAKELRVSTPAVSRMLGNMEKKRLISRSVDKESRRNTFVCLTGQGKEEIALREKLIDRKLKELICHMGQADMEQLILLGNKMVKIMEEMGGKK
ncbi:MAG: MarR family transcriptional regulator [Lachnospiraceae bacterium]|nr:MarR family transcriptional regulator [Lachnospiraceae bacterium]MDD6810693.1 MarR family transcriptional regulator [Lachnospiraceae bacterium]